MHINKQLIHEAILARSHNDMIPAFSFVRPKSFNNFQDLSSGLAREHPKHNTCTHTDLFSKAIR